MTEPIEPLLIAARAATVLCFVGWLGVWSRRAGLVPARWLTALAIALYVACAPGVVEQILALKFPPGDLQPWFARDPGQLVWKFGDRLAELGLFALLLPLVAGIDRKSVV